MIEEGKKDWYTIVVSHEDPLYRDFAKFRHTSMISWAEENVKDFQKTMKSEFQGKSSKFKFKNKNDYEFFKARWGT